MKYLGEHVSRLTHSVLAVSYGCPVCRRLRKHFNTRPLASLSDAFYCLPSNDDTLHPFISEGATSFLSIHTGLLWSESHSIFSIGRIPKTRSKLVTLLKRPVRWEEPTIHQNPQTVPIKTPKQDKSIIDWFFVLGNWQYKSQVFCWNSYTTTVVIIDIENSIITS